VDIKEVTRIFEAELKAELSEAGVELKASASELAAYVEARASVLAKESADNEVGLKRGIRAEKNNVAMRAGLQLSDSGRALDQRIFGMVGVALRVAVTVLTRVVIP